MCDLERHRNLDALRPFSLINKGYTISIHKHTDFTYFNAKNAT